MSSGKIFWFTGLSGSGKTTLARAFEKSLEGRLVRVLDGDEVRKGLCSDLGFSMQDRDENLRRVAEVANLFAESGFIVITSFISPLQKQREMARKLNQRHAFFEIFLDCPLAVCEKRDPKGLYAKARQNLVGEMTGISSPFEKPLSPDLRLPTDQLSLADCIEKLATLI